MEKKAVKHCDGSNSSTGKMLGRCVKGRTDFKRIGWEKYFTKTVSNGI